MLRGGRHTASTPALQEVFLRPAKFLSPGTRIGANHPYLSLTIAAPSRRMTDRSTSLTAPSWRAILRATLREMVTDQASLVAAGCAFYATLALFPAITMLIFVYGLAFDPVTVEPQLKLIEKLLPPEAFSLIAGRVHVLVSQPRGNLGTGLAISIAIAFWSASAGTRAMLSALNLAFNVTEDHRGILGFYAVGFLMTFCAILATATGIALLVFLPALLAFLGATVDTTDFIRWLRACQGIAESG